MGTDHDSVKVIGGRNLAGFLGRHWFFVGMVLMVAGAFWLPGEVAEGVRKWKIIKMGVFFCFFTTGLTLEREALRGAVRNWQHWTAALVSCFVLVPVVAVGLAWGVFRAESEFVMGVCILAVLPVTIASGTVLTRVANGNVPLSLLINVGTNFLAIFTVPLSLELLLRVTLGVEQKIDLPVARMMGQLALMVLLPTVLGLVLHGWLGAYAAKRKKVLSVVAQLIVLLVIFNGVASSTGRIAEAGWEILGMLAFAVLLHVLVLGLNVGISKVLRLDDGSRAALVLHASQKSLTIGYIIWSAYFAAVYPKAFMVTIGYHLVQLVVDSVVAKRWAATRPGV
ncbi:MAG: bile acid:sodium symporter [Sedimentisphaerales bacterium]|nr:bile acid:sodium symporter [Sedimentisphaerales bacterium]